MTILPPDFIAKFLAVHTLPGSVFFHIQEFKLKNGADAALILSAVKRDTGWNDPAYVILIKVSDYWHPCPFISDELYQVIRQYPSATEMLEKIPPQCMAEASKMQSIDQIMRDTEAIRKQSEKAVELKDRILDLSAKDAKTNG